MEILVSNLLSNMLAHSDRGIGLSVSLNNQAMVFSNEGPPLSFPELKLFTRFGKGVPGYHGNGLGLAIVKQICLVNDWQIKYSYESGKHIFSILFQKIEIQ